MSFGRGIGRGAFRGASAAGTQNDEGSNSGTQFGRDSEHNGASTFNSQSRGSSFGRGRGTFNSGPQNDGSLNFENHSRGSNYGRGGYNSQNTRGEAQNGGSNSFGRGAYSRGNSNDQFSDRGNTGRNDYHQRDSYRSQSNFGHGGGNFRGNEQNFNRGPPQNNQGESDNRQGYSNRGNYGQQFAPNSFGRGGRPQNDNYGRNDQDSYQDKAQKNGSSFRGDRSNEGPAYFNRADQQSTGFSRGNDGSSSFSRGGFNLRGGFSNESRNEGSFSRGGFTSRGGFSNESQNEVSFGRGGRGGFDGQQRDSIGRGGISRGNEGSSFGRGGYRGNFSGDRIEGGNNCFNCNQPGHMSRECQEPRKPREGGPNGDCFNCKKSGHFSRDCPQPRQSFSGGPDDVCFNCKQPGHFIRDCSEPSQILEKDQTFVPELLTADQAFDEANQASTGIDVYTEDDKVIVENYPDDTRVFENWADAEFSKQIIENITRRKDYVKPREFQSKTMPIIVEGYDLKGQAETGSGKTAAFLLPIIHKLSIEFANSNEDRELKVSALIIEPTRELAVQLFDQAKMFANKTGVRVNATYGKTKMQYTMDSLRREGCDILIATPGRIVHLISDKLVDVTRLKFFVLDEADELLADSFMQDIEKIAGYLPESENRQTLFFSATLTPETHNLAMQFCKPNSVVVKSSNSGANKRISQQFIHVPFQNRREFLVDYLIQARDKNNGEMPKTLVFVRTKNDANLLAFRFAKTENMTPRSVNGDLPQAEREKATHEFRTGNTRILITTNVFSRGLDIADLGVVINMELPDASENDCRIKYIHRIGRTGRTSQGTAVTFFDPTHPNDIDMAPMIIEELERAGREVPDIVRAAVDPSVKFESLNLNSSSNNANDQEEEDPVVVGEPEF